MRRLLFILLLLVLAAAAAWYFILLPRQQAGNTGTGGFRSFFQIGDRAADLPVVDETVADDGFIPEGETVSPFTQLSAGPVAGYTSYTVTRTVTIPPATPEGKPTTETVTDHIIRYVSRSNGYVYEIINGGIPTQITNIFIPNVYEAYFADANQTAILRFLRNDQQTIATYRVPIPEPNPDNTRTQRDGAYLQDGIQSLAVTPDQKTLARLITDASQGIVTISNSQGTAVREIVRSPFREWLISWANQPYAQTKASANADGYLYRIDIANRRLVRVIGGIPGLTASVSPTGAYVLYSESTQDGYTTNLLNTKTGSVKNLGVSILPEKCVWIASEDAFCAGTDSVISGTYPDSWYLGLSSFTDRLYRVYTSGQLLEDIGNATFPYDMVQLAYSEPQNALYFIDKQTGLLWQYAL